MEKLKDFINVKTIFAFCFILVLIITAVIANMIDAKAVQRAYDEYDGSVFVGIKNELVVINRTSPNVSTSYESTNKTVLDFDYTNTIINRPESTAEDTYFEVKVTFKKGLHSKTRAYTASVIKDEYIVSTIAEVKQSNEDTVKLKNVVISGKNQDGYFVTDGTDYLFVEEVNTFLTVGNVLDIRAEVKKSDNRISLANVVTSTKLVEYNEVQYSSTVATISQVNAMSYTNQDSYGFYKFENVTLGRTTVTDENNKTTTTYYIKSGSEKIIIDARTSTSFINNLKSFLTEDDDPKNEIVDREISGVTIELFLTTANVSNGIFESWNAAYCSSQLNK